MIERLQHMSVMLGRFFSNAVVWCSAIFFSALAVTSLILSAHLIPGQYELEFWWFQSPFVLIISVLIFALIYYARRKNIVEKINLRIVAIVVFAYMIISGFVWILITNVWPEWDSAFLFTAAKYYLDPNQTPVNCAVDTSQLAFIICPGGYLTRFPFQMPLAFLIKLLIAAFGSNAYFIFEVLNIVCSAVTGVLIAYYANILFKNKSVTLLSLLLYALFLPMIFYTTFAYGNTLCLPFVFGALILHAKNIRTGSWWQAIASMICMFFAMLLKSTMAYCLLAMIVVWIISALKSKKFKHAVCVLIALACFMSNNIAVSAISSSFNQNAKNGLPSTVWIAMGTDPVRKIGPNNPGWYSGYPASFDVKTYNKENIKKDSTWRLANNIKHFVNNPSDALSFFTKKLASEWLEPTYESLLASSWRWRGPSGQALLSRKMNRYLRSLYEGKLGVVVFTFLDALQFMLAAFVAVFLCVMLHKRKMLSKKDICGLEFEKDSSNGLLGKLSDIPCEYLTSFVIVCGMLVLYLMWEAQAQYILPAYLLIIPYAARGFDMLLSCYENRSAHNSKATYPSNN